MRGPKPPRVTFPHCRLCNTGTTHSVEECRAREEEYYERVRDDIQEAREQEYDGDEA